MIDALRSRKKSVCGRAAAAHGGRESSRGDQLAFQMSQDRDLRERRFFEVVVHFDRRIHGGPFADYGDRFDTEAVHALSLKTYTPEQWQALQQ